MFPHGVSLECPQEVGAAAVRAALQGCFPAPCLDESFVLAPRLDEAFTRLLELPARLLARLLPQRYPLTIVASAKRSCGSQNACRLDENLILF